MSIRILPALKPTLLFLLTATACNLIVSIACCAAVHEGPDPICHWVFTRRAIVGDRLNSRLGPDATISGEVEFSKEDHGVLLNSNDSAIVVTDDIQKVARYLPQKAFTISAWVTVNQRREWGSILCALQDNGNHEKGLVVGYGKRNFYFGLSTTGADDGDGKMTYLYGKTDYEVGKFYHVVAVYDGQTMQLYVNGKLDAESDSQSGDVLYPKKAPYVIGCYRDADENFPHKGRLREVAVYNLAAKSKWVAGEFSHQQRLTQLKPTDVPNEKLDFVIPPYLQMGSKTSMTVGWQTSKPGTSRLSYGESNEVKQSQTGQGNKFIHHVKLENLKPNTQYFYRVETTDSAGTKIVGKVLTFQTAPDDKTPFAFAVISDTQSNPKVAKKIANLAWGQRPSFMIHPGDLVGTGTNDLHWTEQFFPAMHPLIGRVPMYPVLGNHEVNARNYYDYFQLPDPEYYYDFEYGNAHFFMIDTNKKVGPDSEQYKWLDQALGKSTARWKFVVHHHPPYSSDENDYGNLWKTNRSTRGDLRARELTSLYDKHNVDIVWNGHIHSYERTWPVHDKKVVSGQGTIYMVTGGGGGSLETAGPYRTFFENTVKHGHHYCMVYIHDGELEFKAFDLENRLFDYIKLKK